MINVVYFELYNFAVVPSNLFGIAYNGENLMGLICLFEIFLGNFKKCTAERIHSTLMSKMSKEKKKLDCKTRKSDSRVYSACSHLNLDCKIPYHLSNCNCGWMLKWTSGSLKNGESKTKPSFLKKKAVGPIPGPPWAVCNLPSSAGIIASGGAINLTNFLIQGLLLLKLILRY